jgi:hypothetical protein
VLRREEAARQVEAQYDGPYIDPEKGYMRRNSAELPMFREAIALCRARYPKERIAAVVSKPSKRDTLLSLHLDLDDLANAPIKRIALSPEVLAPIAKYFGGLPVLYGASVWFCRNAQDFDLVGSQLYHFDREDTRQIKIFIPIDDITEDSGPLTLVPAKESRALIENRRRSGGSISLKQRFDDQEVARVTGVAKGVPMTGKSGDLIFLDTTNCLHYGSRPSETYKYHMVLHYVSPFCPKFFRTLDLSAAGDSIDDMVMQFVRSIHDDKIMDG